MAGVVKRFLAIGRPKPEPPKPAEPSHDFERGDLVRHRKTAVCYRIMSVWPSLQAVHARRIVFENDGDWNDLTWRFARPRKTVRLAQANIIYIG